MERIAMKVQGNDTSGGTGSRDPNAIYQRGKVVARVAEAEIDEAGKEVRFSQITDHDELRLPDECEFQKYVLVVRRIAHATKEKTATRERILRGVVAAIVGYREH
jgi:hypothetical protein